MLTYFCVWWLQNWILFGSLYIWHQNDNLSDQEQSCMLCGICFTWLKETRYKGTLNSFCTQRSPLKFERNFYSGFFVTYGERMHMYMSVCVCTHAQVWFCSNFAFISSFSTWGLSFQILVNTGLYSSFRKKEGTQGKTKNY